MTPSLSAEPHAPPAPARPDGPWLVIDRDDFLRHLNARACPVRHRLTEHPLFEMPRLLELARWLPEKYVRINSGAVPVDATPEQIPGTGLSVEESFRRIAETDTRIMLKKIELHPDYRDLLHTCLAEIEALGHPCTRGVFAREGYVFLSAPRQTTPFHMDPEINFLLQIRGRKCFYVLPGDDRSILSEKEIELFYSPLHPTLTFPPETDRRAVPFDMRPGDGVHIPVNHPHWVKTFDDVTISFALTLQTTAARRRGVIYAVNHRLRRWGLNPAPFGTSAVRDFLKYQSHRLWGALKWCLPRRRHNPTH